MVLSLLFFKGRLASDKFCFPSSHNDYFPFIPIIYFEGYRIHSWQIFNIWKILCYFFLVFMFSDERSTAVQISVPSENTFLSKKIWFLVLVFSFQIFIICLDTDFGGYVWVYTLYSFCFLNPEDFQFSWGAQSCPTHCDPMNRSTPGLPVHHQLQGSLTLTSIESVTPSSNFILCRSLLLLPPIPPSIRVFSNESALHMTWPKYWSFSFSIIPSKEIPGLISLRIDWLDLLAVQGTLKSLLQHHSSKASILRRSDFFTVQLSHPYMTTGKTIVLTRPCWQK